MKTTVLTPLQRISLLLISLLGLVGSACQRADTNANTNSNLAANANTSATNANANLSPESTSVTTAREPEKYRAVLVFSAETEGGQKTIGIPTLSAEVARNGADRRVAFKLPDGSDLIYLPRAGRQAHCYHARPQAVCGINSRSDGFPTAKINDTRSNRFVSGKTERCGTSWR